MKMLKGELPKGTKVMMTPEEIISKGLSKEDPIAETVVEMFSKIYGTEVGNLAIRMLCYGGVYLTGTLTNMMKEYLCKTDEFFVIIRNNNRVTFIVKGI